MKDQLSITKSNLKELITSYSLVFDIVRLVDPRSMTVYTLQEDQLIQEPYHCYHVWTKTGRCDNCISAKCYTNHHRYSKFEFIDKDVYHVIAQNILVDEQEYVLEIVTLVHDDVLLTAYGTNDFVDKITDYNHRLYEDELTGLNNRRYLDERFPMVLSSAHTEGTSLTTLMIDIDNFKQVNDDFGHPAGDQVLQFVASSLKNVFYCDQNDIVARYGGDEFVVAVKGLAKPDLLAKIDKVNDLIHHSSQNFSLSFGAYYKEKIETQEPIGTYISIADQALYEVKKNCKGDTCVIE